MRPRTTLAFLVVFALFGAALWVIGDSMEQSSRGGPIDAEGWLAEHGEEAERVARRLLDDRPLPPLSMTMASAEPRRVGDAVVFRLRGGSARLDGGVAYAPDGAPPALGAGGALPLRWEPFRGAWWVWEGE